MLCAFKSPPAATLVLALALALARARAVALAVALTLRRTYAAPTLHLREVPRELWLPVCEELAALLARLGLGLGLGSGLGLRRRRDP